MNTLSTLCNNFIENRDILKNIFSWESPYMYPVCASVFTEKGILADPQNLRICQDILKKNTGSFSSFRGTAKLALLSMMATQENPEEFLLNALEVYASLKQHFYSSDHLTLTSMVVANLIEPHQYKMVAAKTKLIYNLMKKEHPFLTSGEDSVFAALLALSPLSEEEIVTETEKCYQLLKRRFSSGNAVQSLSHVLALCEGTAEEKCGKTIELYEKLKQRGYKYGTDYELASLGVLAMLPTDEDTILHDIIDIDTFLEKQKGYGFWGIGKKQRLMHAGMLVSGSYTGQNSAMNSAVIGSTISLIVAQQVAMCATIAATSSAANSGN